ncbi:MAG: hypothetical protein ACXWEM_06865 [Halobacteriota archaeon]
MVTFVFLDTCPLEVSSRIDLADGKDLRRAGERLRAALEYTFSLAVKENDDGILRYAIHYIDKNEFYKNHWENVEPFLKRCVVHFGHTVDYVSRLIVWRHFVHDDVDHKNWKKILQTVLDNNGRLGNDSEVCWAIYACIHLDLKIGAETSQKILENCCALTIIALLHFANGKLSEKTKKSIFDNARQLLTEKSASGPYWPLALEWRSCKWLRHDEVRMNNKTIQAMADHGVVLFDAKKLPKVFEGKKVNEFGKVKRAIERRVGLYDDEEEYEESEGYEDYDAENQYENS